MDDNKTTVTGNASDITNVVEKEAPMPTANEPEITSSSNIEEIDAVIEDAQDFLHRIENYREKAQYIDNRVETSREGYVPLDDLPYGEELIRLRELPDVVEDAIETLENIDGLKPTEAALKFNDATSVIEEAKSILDDCTALPDDDD